jgi:hypothetical protein
MASKEQLNAELEEHIDFIKTPPQAPAKFAVDEDCGVEVTNVSSHPRPLRHSIAEFHLTELPVRYHQQCASPS